MMTNETLNDESCDELGEEKTEPPYSQFLKYYGPLKLSNANFEKEISSDLEKQKGKSHSHLLLLENLTFPTLHETALFVSKTNIDPNPNESLKDYEKRLELPGNWKLLTTATSAKGYFGSAYWNPECRQVLIAHRGTTGENTKKELNFIFENYIDQIEPACTFAHEIHAVLEKHKTLGLQLFFTGHDTGGGLAQITTFSVKYLTRVKGPTLLFMKRPYTDDEGFHSHTVTFDSPGCSGLLEKLADEFDVRYEDNSTEFRQLNINNYMLIPNMINCCEKQTGTNFLICPTKTDTTLMQQVNNPFDSLKLILEYVLNPFTSLYEVVDWPVNETWSDVDEIQTLFHPKLKWIENHQPDTKDRIFLLVKEQCEGYYPIRYQIKRYNGYKLNISVFTEPEIQFLQYFQWLNGVPEYFKPEKLFNDDENCTYILNQLNKIEVKKKSVRCTPESNILSMIPFVKRLLKIYPDILEKTSSALTSTEIRKYAYGNESTEYCKRLAKITKVFQSRTALSKTMERFLADKDRKICQVVTGNDTDIVAAQILNSVKASEGFTNKLILRWKNILAINKSINFKKVLTSDVSLKILMIDMSFSEIEEETQILFTKLMKLLKTNTAIKLIIINKDGTACNKYIQSKLKYYDNPKQLINYDGIKWSDLDIEERKQLLTKPLVTFQGTKDLVNLDTILPYRDSKYLQKILDSETIISLIKNRVINLGNEIADLGNVEDYYVPRVLQLDFKLNAAILHHLSTQDLFAVTGVDEFYLRDNYGLGGEDIKVFDERDETIQRVTILNNSNAETNFSKLIQQISSENLRRTVHWIEIRGHELYWKQTIGDFKLIEKYLSTDEKHLKLLPTLCKNENGTTSQLNEVHIASKIKQVREYLISDTAGMGKSTTLTHLAHEIKLKWPLLWVVRINLNDCTEVLRDELVKRQNTNAKKDNFDGVQFLLNQMMESNPITKFATQFEKTLFKECLDKDDGVVLMFDGFDEICPNYDQIFVEIITELKSTKVQNIFITTRPQTQDQIECIFDTPSFKLRPFYRQDKERFLIDFWKSTNSIHEESLSIKAKSLIKAFSINIKDGQKEFSGIPLQCRMLAEVYELYTIENLPEKISLVDLYEAFVNKKLKVYETDKCLDFKGNINALDSEDLARTLIREYHHHLALKLLNLEDCSLLEEQSFYPNIKEILSKKSLKVGLVSKTGDVPVFVHRTFAEYFVADYFTTAFAKSPISGKVANAFMNKMKVFDFDFIMVTHFINDRLVNWPYYDQAVEGFGSYLSKSWDNYAYSWKGYNGCTAFHAAAERNHDELFKYFVDCSLKDENTAQKLVSFFSSLCMTKTPLRTRENASGKFDTQHFEYFLRKIKNLSSNLQRKYLLANIFTKNCNESILDILMNDTKLGDTASEIRSKVHLIDKFRHAAEKGDLEDLKQTLQETDTDTRHYLTLSCGEDCSSVLNLSLRNGHLEAANFIINQVPSAIPILLSKSYNSVLLSAVESCKLEVVKFVIEKFKNEYMLTESTPVIRAITMKRVDMLSLLLEQGFSTSINSGANKDTFLRAWGLDGTTEITETLLSFDGISVNASDSRNRTLLHFAVYNRNTGVTLRLLKYGANVNAKDNIGNTPLHQAALNEMIKKCNRGIISILIEHGGELLSKNFENKTPLDIAISVENTEEIAALVPFQPFITSLSLNARKWLWKDALPQKLTKNELSYFNLKLNDQPIPEDQVLQELTAKQELIFYQNDMGVMLFTHEIYVDYFTAEYFLDQLSNILSNSNTTEHFINFFIKESCKEMRTIFLALLERHENKDQILKKIIELLCGYWFRTPQPVFQRTKLRIWKTSDLYERENILGLILRILTEECMEEFVVPCIAAIYEEMIEVVFKAVENENEQLLDIFFKFLSICPENFGMKIISHTGDMTVQSLEYLLFLIENYPSLKNIFKNLLQKRILGLKFLEAAETGSVDVLRIMLSEAMDQETRNALFEATRRTTDFDKELFSYRGYYRALNLAIKNGHHETVQFLIQNEAPINTPVVPQKHGIDILEQSDCIIPPLFNAIKLGNIEMVKLLLDNGANINAKIDRHCVVSLAVEHQFLEFCKLLLSWQYRDKQIDKSGALHIALDQGYTEIALLLIKAGANVNELNDIERTPLNMAASQDTPESLLLALLERGANVNYAGSDGKTALHFAALNEWNVNVVPTLLSRGADINARDINGQTPLFIAAKWGTIEMVKSFLANGALVNAQDNIGETPLHLAAMEGRDDIATLLLNSGANPDLSNNYNEKPIDTAETFQRAKIVDILLKFERK